MDIRIEKTKTALHNTFLELRSRKPLEKITIKELCEKAQINKSTFYSHYKDIYDLSDQLETSSFYTPLSSPSYVNAKFDIICPCFFLTDGHYNVIIFFEK